MAEVRWTPQAADDLESERRISLLRILHTMPVYSFWMYFRLSNE